MLQKYAFTMMSILLLCYPGALLQDGRIAEQVARDAGQVEIAKYLQEKRLTAPAQLVYRIEGTNANIWIGEQVRHVSVLFQCKAVVTWCVAIGRPGPSLYQGDRAGRSGGVHILRQSTQEKRGVVD
jgi:hypothetical protein